MNNDNLLSRVIDLEHEVKLLKARVCSCGSKGVALTPGERHCLLCKYLGSYGDCNQNNCKYHVWDKESKACPECKGEGVINLTDGFLNDQPCATCNGTGKVEEGV